MIGLTIAMICLIALFNRCAGRASGTQVCKL